MRLAVASSLWTAFVWGTRIRNAVRDDAGAGPVLLSLTFLALAAATLVWVWRARRSGRPEPWGRPLLAALAAWTAAVWAVRAVDIAVLSDHDAGFVVVHLALAAVSTALAAGAWRGATLEAMGGENRRLSPRE